MDTTASQHDMHALFAQLGIANDEKSVRAFIGKHKLKDQQLPLHEADFWSEGQKAFLKEAICDDSNWAIVVDALDVALRAKA